jgi:hypothetical protein
MLNYPLAFVERLTSHDLEVLAALDEPAPEVDDLRARLQRDPGAIEEKLADPRLYDLIFESTETGMIPGLTPLLAFAVLVHRTMRDLRSASYVPEWVGAGERLPVFDVESLREFIDNVTRRFLISEFLSSFTRVASGSVWVRTERGYRRRRYSELDPVGLAEMVESLPSGRRAAGYRRLGDVALFHTGIFPDHTARHPISAMRQARLATLAGVDLDDLVGVDYFQFLEKVGSVCYDRAANEASLPSQLHESLEDMATNFTRARRFLNFLADRYLHQHQTGLMNPVA